MNVKIIKKDFELVLNEIKKTTPVVIYKNFLNINDCKKIVSLCHKNFSYKIHRKKKPNKFFNFTSLDVLPSNVKCNRIFRTFELSNFFINKFKSLKNIQNLQNKIIKLKKNKKVFKKAQVIQYPRGGGFFGEHVHERYPTNYGFIITLTKKNKDFYTGETKFKINGKNIDIKKCGVTIGDLILFRYDLLHSVSSCDPLEDLIFDKKGRWTLIFPVHDYQF